MGKTKHVVSFALPSDDTDMALSTAVTATGYDLLYKLDAVIPNQVRSFRKKSKPGFQPI